nr:hypothetical protein [Tanacetum cinerariifolium]
MAWFTVTPIEHKKKRRKQFRQRGGWRWWVEETEKDDRLNKCIPSIWYAIRRLTPGVSSSREGMKQICILINVDTLTQDSKKFRQRGGWRWWVEETEKDDRLNKCIPSIWYAVRRLTPGVSSSREEVTYLKLRVFSLVITYENQKKLLPMNVAENIVIVNDTVSMRHMGMADTRSYCPNDGRQMDLCAIGTSGVSRRVAVSSDGVRFPTSIPERHVGNVSSSNATVHGIVADFGDHYCSLIDHAEPSLSIKHLIMFMESGVDTTPRALSKRQNICAHSHDENAPTISNSIRVGYGDRDCSSTGHVGASGTLLHPYSGPSYNVDPSTPSGSASGNRARHTGVIY